MSQDVPTGGRPLGPHVKQLWIEYMGIISVPPGGGLADAVRSLQRLPEIARQAERQMRAALDAVKAAPDNPYGTDDEAIASHILQALATRRSGRPAQRKGEDHDDLRM